MDLTKKIIEILAAGLAPITAIFALLLASRQYRLEKLRTRQSLYERRLALFNSTMAYLSHIFREAGVEQEQLFKFLGETKEAYFLLGKEIHDYLMQLYDHGVDLMAVNHKLRQGRIPVGEERNRLADEACRLTKWFSDQFEIAREKFAEHLRLDG